VYFFFERKLRNTACLILTILNLSDLFFSEEEEIGDTVCGLSIHEKIRLCTLVLNAKRYRTEVRFVPHENNIEPKCSSRAVRFRYDRDDLTWDYDVDKDWMIGCRAVKVVNKKSVIYRISAGFQVYKYFICEAPGLENTFLSGISCRIRVKEKESEFQYGSYFQ
jgi:hypothetical protein